VSIGLPVFNGERYLEEALRSILSQTYRAFELIISDNGSTDRTREICERYARQDARIRYTRSPVNRGAAWNFRRVFELARGEYFKWAAHDDVLEPDFLRCCVEALDTDPTLVVVQSATREIDAKGRRRGFYAATVGSADPCERFRLALDTKYPFELFGLMRASVLGRTSLIGPSPQSDLDLLQQLVLLGDFGRIERPLFSRRSHAESYTDGGLSYREGLAWMDPNARSPYAVYCLTRFCRLNLNVLRAPLPWAQRLRCLGLSFARSARELRRRLHRANAPQIGAASSKPLDTKLRGVRATVAVALGMRAS
jgi:glycosyltransferase involved in cell wall biosynthesis